ncbi:MAG: YggT family protein [Nautiliaceae bacterium]
MNVILISILQFISVVLNIYSWVIIISALITWVQPNPYNPIVRFLFAVTEPVYAFIRRYIPTNFGGIDIAPIIVLLGIELINILIHNIILALYQG